MIDGEAGTSITAWDGDRSSLGWIRHDVTSLAYRIRRGAAAVLGVGGGRDVLAAIEGGSAPIVGVEINGILVELLTRSHRRFAGIADAPGVELVHDEARSYLSRDERRFDIVQMSPVDTWAATGAGAFTLSENGLYTREAWRLFLDALTPSGVLSVSRWFDPTNVSETNRLTALAVAALLDRGVSHPRGHVLLVASGPVATVLGDNGQIIRALKPDGTPQLNEDGTWHRDVVLEDRGTILDMIPLDTTPLRDLGPDLANRFLKADVIMLAGAFGLFEWALARGLAEPVARTITVNVFVFVQMFCLFNCRSLTYSVFHVGLFSNPWVWLGVGIMTYSKSSTPTVRS